MIDFRYRPIYEVHIFSVSENRENGLGDEGSDRGNASRIFGLEPPLEICNQLDAILSPVFISLRRC